MYTAVKVALDPNALASVLMWTAVGATCCVQWYYTGKGMELDKKGKVVVVVQQNVAVHVYAPIQPVRTLFLTLHEHGSPRTRTQGSCRSQ